MKFDHLSYESTCRLLSRTVKLLLYFLASTHLYIWLCTENRPCSIHLAVKATEVEKKVCMTVLWTIWKNFHSKLKMQTELLLFCSLESSLVVCLNAVFSFNSNSSFFLICYHVYWHISSKSLVFCLFSWLYLFRKAFIIKDQPTLF